MKWGVGNVQGDDSSSVGHGTHRSSGSIEGHHAIVRGLEPISEALSLQVITFAAPDCLSFICLERLIGVELIMSSFMGAG